MEKARFPLVLGVLPLLGLHGCDIGSDETLVTSSGIVNKGILSMLLPMRIKRTIGYWLKVYPQPWMERFHWVKLILTAPYT